MFTGIVTETGTVASLAKRAGGAVLKVRATQAAADARLGDSIAVDGCCLTVTHGEGEILSFDLSAETLDSTTLGGLKPGAMVNIEPALRADGKLGGHFVTGHVDAVGTVRRKLSEGEMLRYEIQAPAEVMRYLVPKGSVAVDGISLTVVAVMENAFSLVVIPHTTAETTLADKGQGARVNLESDIIGKYVRRFLERTGDGGGGLRDVLIRSGFAAGAET
jgi:riboflavin synthase